MKVIAISCRGRNTPIREPISMAREICFQATSGRTRLSKMVPDHRQQRGCFPQPAEGDALRRG